MIEDEDVKQWQQCVKFGQWIIADKSRLAGWYHSACMIGPDEKPIHTGAATLHSMAVTHQKLMFHKLYARMYGGKHNGNIQGWHKHNVNKAKFCNLFNIMLSLFCGKGHHATYITLPI